MRRARILGGVGAGYHCLSRVVGGEFLLGNVEKEKFRVLMRQVEGFSGVRILTYAILSNHFHLLLEVPERRALGDEELLRRLEYLYSARYVSEVRGQLEGYRAEGREDLAEALRVRYLVRMSDISEFMKTLKQRFTQWYNGSRERKGTLWEERFKSVLVEFKPEALRTIAAYIDLNAVRAGLVDDPKDYRFCGYGEAVGGSRRSRQGLGRVLEERPGQWGQTSRGYRQLLYGRAGRSKKRAGISPEEVREMIETGGELSREELLRCRVRYLTEGLVLGSRGFVEEVLGRQRERLGLRRPGRARPMKYADWGGLCTLRNLKRQPVHPGIN